MSIPNFLTVFRIGIIPFFVLFFYLPFDWAIWPTAIIFALVGVSDYLDGYLARKMQQSTPLGAFLDPVADKLIVTVSMIMLAGYYHDWLMISCAAIIILREVIISALREWMGMRGLREVVAVSWMGKYKTTAQMFAIQGFILGTSDSWLHYFIYPAYPVMAFAISLTIASGYLYLKAAWPHLTAHDAV